MPIIVENRKGGPQTIARNDKYGAILLDAGGRDRFEHTGGGSKSETHLKQASGADGASFLDGTIRSKKTGRRLFWNDISVLADGKTPTSREARQSRRVMINKKTGDIYAATPKPKAGEEVNWEEVQRLGKELLEELDREFRPGENIGPREWTTTIQKLPTK